MGTELDISGLHLQTGVTHTIQPPGAWHTLCRDENCSFAADSTLVVNCSHLNYTAAELPNSAAAQPRSTTVEVQVPSVSFGNLVIGRQCLVSFVCVSSETEGNNLGVANCKLDVLGDLDIHGQVVFQNLSQTQVFQDLTVREGGRLSLRRGVGILVDGGTDMYGNLALESSSASLQVDKYMRFSSKAKATWYCGCSLENRCSRILVTGKAELDGEAKVRGETSCSLFTPATGMQLSPSLLSSVDRLGKFAAMEFSGAMKCAGSKESYSWTDFSVSFNVGCLSNCTRNPSNFLCDLARPNASQIAGHSQNTNTRGAGKGSIEEQVKSDSSNHLLSPSNFLVIVAASAMAALLFFYAIVIFLAYRQTIFGSSYRGSEHPRRCRGDSSESIELIRADPVVQNSLGEVTL